MNAPNIRAAAVVVGRATRCVMGNVSFCFTGQEPKERCICAKIAQQVLDAAACRIPPDHTRLQEMHLDELKPAGGPPMPFIKGYP